MADERKNLSSVTYVGTCKGLIEKKGGWYAVEIAAVGKSYTIKADTKLENLLTQARASRDNGTVCTWTVEEWDSDNINPNNDKPYTERRLAGVEEGVHEGAQNQQNATASPSGGQKGSGASSGDGMSKEEWRAKDRAADKRALTAQAVSALTHTMPSDPTDDDLNKFMVRVAHLTVAWMNDIEAVRNGDDVPF